MLPDWLKQLAADCTEQERQSLKLLDGVNTMQAQKPVLLKKDNHLVLWIDNGVLFWRCGGTSGSHPVSDTDGRYSGEQCAQIVDRIKSAVDATSVEWLS